MGGGLVPPRFYSGEKMTTLIKPSRRKLSQDEVKKMRDKDHKMVKGIFRCFEPIGGSMTFSFRKHKGDQVLTYTMIDGDTYDVPMMVAKHLNQDCWYPKHVHILDANGNPRQDVGKKVRRCSFESLEFHDAEANDTE